MEYRPGMLAKSLAGHDQNKIYIIIQEDEYNVFLSDGKNRTLDNLKKKKKIANHLFVNITSWMYNNLEKHTELLLQGGQAAVQRTRVAPLSFPCRVLGW